MTRKEYLAHAAECETLADQAKLASVKQALLTSAEMWRKLAAARALDDGAGSRPKLGSRAAK
jgi:hypothetical protein